MKLINTAEAGEILGVANTRVRHFISIGLLKDFNPVNPKHTRHVNKLSVTEVREFKKKYHIEYRTVRPKVGSNNGQPQKRGKLISTVQNSGSDESITVTVPLSEPIKAQLSDRLMSIEERLTAIENRIVDTLERKLNDIIKLWA